MSRDGVCALKRQLHGGKNAFAAEEQRRLAEAAALALLERSVRMRHRHLAVLRLRDAVVLGVCVPDEHWIYCRGVAAASSDAAVQALFSESEQTTCGRTGLPGEARRG